MYSHFVKDAKAKVQQSEETLKEEKSAADKKVRELTFKLDVRAEDISKKEVYRHPCRNNQYNKFWI